MKEKFLIAFDTNTLRHTYERDIIIDKFKFSKQFDEILKSVQEKCLTDCINFIIPEIVFKELIEQKVLVYERERDNALVRLNKISFIAQNEIAKFKEILLNKNYKELIQKEAEDYIKTNNVKIIKLDKADENKVFQRLIEKSLRGLPPFSYNPNEKESKKDSGFKDAVAFETLKEYCLKTSAHKVYTGIYFITKDTVFKAESLKGEIVKFKHGLDIKEEGNSLIQDILIKNAIAKQLSIFSDKDSFSDKLFDEAYSCTSNYDTNDSFYKSFNDYEITTIDNENNFKAIIYSYIYFDKCKDTETGDVDLVTVNLSTHVTANNGDILIDAIETELEIENIYNAAEEDYYADLYAEQIADEARGK